MSAHVGVDWASNGWVVAELDDEGDLTVGFYPTVWNLWHERGDAPERVLVDVPIGLPADGRRECDEEAKARLGDRRSSVFWTPIRPAVYEDDVEAAKDVQEAAVGHSISNQAWAIVPRIREVDGFLWANEDARETVRESHPEVCFRALSDDPLDAKSVESGADDRKELLCEELDLGTAECEEVVRTLTEPDYAPRAAEDDVLDAMVLAVTARYVADGDYATLPDDPPTDEEGLPMEIVYPDG